MSIGHSKLLIPLMAAVSTLIGCSGSQPSKDSVASTTARTNVTPTPASPGGSSDSQKLTAERILQLQREGYKLINRDGQTYYCRTEAKTGSHLARDTVCMTEAEATSLRDQTKQGLGRVMREQPPPQGR